PEGYLAKVMQALVRGQIVSSQRGAKGGFTLTRDPADVTLLDVVLAVDPSRRIAACPLGIEEHAHKLCPLHQKLDQAAATVEQILRSTTISVMIQDRACETRSCANPVETEVTI